ncbi:MAG: CDP-diacylglycerol--glycerol-3-phosphate 3-phosphatidyltransferase [Spirochaetes bacterium]|nr:CDP-diacylglycerol--glycerol-3-phosphate 3-phosphatidyltransferase [Spirochaetota bacterium]
MAPLFTIANMLTAVRVIIVPFFILSVFGLSVASSVGSLLLFGAAALSDYLDGLFARKTDTVSRFGEFLDPLADKLLVGGAFIAFALLPDLFVPFWLIVIILMRELFVTMLRVVAIRRNHPMRTESAGKLKTAVQMGSIVCILILLLVKRAVTASLLNAGSPLPQDSVSGWLNLFGEAGRILYFIPLVLISASALLALLSMVRYVLRNRSLFVRKG